MASSPAVGETRKAYFALAASGGREVLTPLAPARSGWGGGGQLNGSAVSGALIRATERLASELGGADSFRPVRWAVDLYRPAAAAECAVDVTVVRQGRRLRLIDAALVQDGIPVARSSLLLLVTGEAGEGTTWSGSGSAAVAILRRAVGCWRSDAYYSDGVGWTRRLHDHRNAHRKATWHPPTPIVDGETLSPLQHAAAVADIASLVVGWGTTGAEYINTDVGLVLSRRPRRVDGVGLVAQDRAEEEGVAVGRATLFDRDGDLGEVTVSTIRSPERAQGNGF